MFRLLPLLLALTLAACSSSQPDAEAPAPDAVAAGETGATPPSASDTGIFKPIPAELPQLIARVNGHDISRTDLEEAVRAAENRAGGPVPPEERDRVYRRLLDDIISYRLLVQETENRKVTVADAEVDAGIARLRQQFGSEDAFRSVLTQQNLTLDQLRTNTRRDLGVEKLLQTEVGPKVTVRPAEVSAFYVENPDMFRTPEQVRASHILISAPASADQQTRAAARARAETVLKSARSGQDFAALAREHSQDPGSAASGGDLGMFRPGDMVGPFNDAAFSLAVGTISNVVETDFGYHIIKVVEKQPAGTVPLEQARTDIENYLQNISRQRETQAFVQGLRTKGTVEVFI